MQHADVIIAGAGPAGSAAALVLGEGIFYALLTGRYAGETLAYALETGEDPGPAYGVRSYDWGRKKQWDF